MRARVALPALLCLLLAAGLASLGTWQVQRRAWKRDLVARVESRLAAPAILAPLPGRDPPITRARDEYLRVSTTGRFLPGCDTLVRAVTVLGPGYWLMTPFRDARGFTVIVNRGFVPARTPLPPPRDDIVTGLLRLTEPNGTLLAANRPALDRWYSRDVAAIAARCRLGAVAPYFIDAAAAPDSTAFPRGGLTIVTFTDRHMLYALIWYALALLSVTAAVRVLRAP